MGSFTLDELAAAVRAAWCAETTFATPLYLARGPGRGSRGQCGPTALVVHDYLGGHLLLSQVSVGGSVAGAHWWNRLPSGAEVDLTRDQFLPDELVLVPRVVRRPPLPRPPRALEAYVLLRDRVAAALGAPGGSVSEVPLGSCS